MNRSWVPVWREAIANDPDWPGNTKSPFPKMDAWLDLYVLLARGVANDKLKKDQLFASERFLAKRWCWSRAAVQRFLRAREKAGYLTRHENSIITIHRPLSEAAWGDPPTDPLSDPPKPPDQKGLFATTDPLSDPPTDPIRETVEKVKEEIHVLGAEAGPPRTAAERILAHCLEQGPWRGFRIGKSKKAALERINRCLKDGYVEADLIRYVDVYLGRRRAHIRFKKIHAGEDPSPIHRCWCPNPTWSIEELFSRGSGKYFAKWIDGEEEPLTKEKIERIEDQDYEIY